MDSKTKLQKKRKTRNERIAQLFVKIDASKCRRAEMIADKLACSKSTVINALKADGLWR